MHPSHFAEFDFSVGHSHHRQRATLMMAAYCAVAAVMINMPIMSLIKNWPVAVGPSQAKTAVEAVSLPDPKPKIVLSVAPPDHTPEDNAKLTNLMTDFANSHAGTYGVTLINLGNPANIVTHNGDTNMLTASTYKLFAAYNALSKVEQGIWSMSTPTAYGTLDYCLQRAIKYSDNNCGEAIGGQLGWHRMTLFIQAAGFKHTWLDGSRGTLNSSSNDEAELLKRLYNGSLLNPEHTKYLLDLMKSQIYRSGIPAGSSGSVVANKVGNLDTTNDDAAIVYSPKATYVLVIMTDGSSVAAIRDLSQQIYNFYNP